MRLLCSSNSPGNLESSNMKLHEYQSKELLSRYGDLVTYASGSGYTVVQDTAHKKVRLVVASCHIRRHSVWNVILRGLLTHLNRQKFEIIVYHLGRTEDEETIFAHSAVDGWRDVHSISDLGGVVAGNRKRPA